jgi:hypothetical protein
VPGVVVLVAFVVVSVGLRHAGLAWKAAVAHIRGRSVLSFSEVRGARRLDSEPYNLWLSPGRREFFLLAVLPLPPLDSRVPSPP